MKLAVALDCPTVAENLNLFRSIDGHLTPELKAKIAFKVGLNTFIAGGPEFIKAINLPPYEIALDLKLHDIPNTMAAAAKQIARLGIAMFTVHASAGEHAIQIVRHAIHCPEFENPPKILAVTVLTSVGDGLCERIYKSSVPPTLHRLVNEAALGFADGIVLSPADLPFVKHWLSESMGRQGPPPKMITFVPGIELEQRKDDQVRKGTIRSAMENGADYIVVGRPIYQSDDPVFTTLRLIDKMDRIRQSLADLKNLEVWP